MEFSELKQKQSNETEITARSILLGIVLTAILAASNVYLALKLGHTIAASIPAAVLSMAILKFFKNSHILESNLVQTAASAGEGVAAAISFILPALIITGYWQHFFYWQTVSLVLIGGMLGLFFSIPLRRILLNHRDLTFPEGTAIGQVMKVSISHKDQFKHLLIGGFLGSTISLVQTGFKLISDNWQLWFIKDRFLFGTALGFSPALLAAGFIVGIQASIAMLVGLVLGWVIGIPTMSLLYQSSGQTAYDMAMQLWNEHIRFIGVGTMLIGGAWTLIILIKPILKSLKISFATIHTIGQQPATEVKNHDLPMNLVVTGTMVFLLLSLIWYYHFLSSQTIVLPFASRFTLSFIAMILTLLGGFFLASVCAYLSGLVGMTNNPLSGLMLIAVVIIAFLLSSFSTPSFTAYELTFVIYITSVIAIITAISGENIQDLKAGQILNATPWKQQFMIMVGVVVAAFVVQPVLELLFEAYGIGGIFPSPHMDRTQMLPAPQASLITAVAKGVLGKTLPGWEIGTGCLIAVLGILLDKYIKKYNKRLPILAIGLGIYLPPDIILPVIIGGFVNYFVGRKLGKTEKSGKITLQSGILLACGIVAGSALMGVVLAIPFVIAGNSNVLRILPDSLKIYSNIMGVIVTLFLCWKLYNTSLK